MKLEKEKIESKETLNWINPWTPPLSEDQDKMIGEIIP